MDQLDKKIDEYLAALYKSTNSKWIVDYFLKKYSFYLDSVIKKLLLKFSCSPFNFEDLVFFKYKATIESLKYYHRSLNFLIYSH